MIRAYKNRLVDVDAMPIDLEIDSDGWDVDVEVTEVMPIALVPLEEAKVKHMMKHARKNLHGSVSSADVTPEQ